MKRIAARSDIVSLSIEYPLPARMSMPAGQFFSAGAVFPAGAGALFPACPAGPMAKAPAAGRGVRGGCRRLFAGHPGLQADEVAEQARFDLLFPQCTPGQRQVRRGTDFSGLQGGSPPSSQALMPAPAGRWRTAPLPGSAGTCGRRSRWSRSGRPARGPARPWPRRRRLPARTCRC